MSHSLASNSDPDAKETRLAAEVAAYDQKLAAGGKSHGSSGSVTDEDLSEFIKAKECIDLLKFVWPRGDATTSQAESPPPPSEGAKAPEPEAPQTLDIPGYRILGLIGRGGMGVVYRAFQFSLEREVALKFLPPLLMNDAERLERFKREARFAASVTGAGILPIYDVLQVDDLPVLAMQLVNGMDLGRILSKRVALHRGVAVNEGSVHPWALLPDAEYREVVLTALDQLIAAVAALHAAGITHRDIKPSNILVDDRDNVWLSDFGLARLADESSLTRDGSQLGSRGFMSPEQWDGHTELDHRVDVFGLGATVYQAISLTLPYGTRPLNKRTPRVSRLPGDSGSQIGELEHVILKALEPDRRDRYNDARELARVWTSVRNGADSGERRPFGRVRRFGRRMIRGTWSLSDICLAVGFLAILILAWKGSRSQPVPPVVPVPSQPTRTISINTVPQKARVVLVPIHPQTGVPIPERRIRPPGDRRTPLRIDGVPPGDYLVEVEVEGHGFQEVFRHVPAEGDYPYSYSLANGVAIDLPHRSFKLLADGTAQLPGVVIPNASVLEGMAELKGNLTFTIGDPILGLQPHAVAVHPFAIDTAEVTNSEFLKVFGVLPEHAEEDHVPEGENHPVVDVNFDVAMTYAERVGKRLPWEREYEFAATLGGTIPLMTRAQFADKSPRKPWPFGEVKRPDDPDRLWVDPVVFGLFSNAAEWTLDWPAPYAEVPKALFPKGLESIRVVRGGSYKTILRRQLGPKDPPLSPRSREGISKDRQHPGLGFRTVRSLRPRYLVQTP